MVFRYADYQVGYQETRYAIYIGFGFSASSATAAPDVLESIYASVQTNSTAGWLCAFVRPVCKYLKVLKKHEIAALSHKYRHKLHHNALDFPNCRANWLTNT